MAQAADIATFLWTHEGDIREGIERTTSMVKQLFGKGAPVKKKKRPLPRKFFDNSTIIQSSENPPGWSFASMPTGTQVYAREGDSVRLTSLRIRYIARPTTYGTQLVPDFVRIVIVRAMGRPTVNPWFIADDVLATTNFAGGIVYLAPRYNEQNVINSSQLQILYDRSHPTPPYTSDSETALVTMNGEAVMNQITVDIDVDGMMMAFQTDVGGNPIVTSGELLLFFLGEESSDIVPKMELLVNCRTEFTC